MLCYLEIDDCIGDQERLRLGSRVYVYVRSYDWLADSHIESRARYLHVFRLIHKYVKLAAL
jgi:hypothetical protein